MVKCCDGTLYTGITNDLERRLQAHNQGTASKYTRVRRPVTLVYREGAVDRSAASKREYALKKLTRAQKQKLIEKAETKAGK